MEPNIELAKPRDFGEIISDTFMFIRQNFKGLLKSFFIFCGFFLVAGALAMCIMQYKTNYATTRQVAGVAAEFGNLSELAVSIIGVMVFALLSFTANLTTIICYVTLYKNKANTEPTTEEMWAYFKYYFLRVLGASIVIWLLLSVGYMVCLIPGIWLFPILGLIFPIMIIENASFGYAFSRAFKLISNNWWITAGAVFIVWLIAYCMMFFISLPLSLVNVSSMLLRPQVMPTVSMGQIVLGSVLQQLMQVILVIPTVGICLCYFNLTESKDGTSLLNRIDKFGEQNTQPDLPSEEY
ncbi:hypothetical protein [Mucilaginibacter sp.]|uniref:hypothetical protein n=1 Tax=Mucilaginibacter sp. TaxID=1882438 RepID=UPI003263FD0E